LLVSGVLLAHLKSKFRADQFSRRAKKSRNLIRPR